MPSSRHRARPAPAPAAKTASRRWFSRIGWLLLIWACSVAALGVVAWLLRIVMNAAGLTA